MKNRFLSVFLFSMLFMGCRTGKVSVSNITEADTTRAQIHRDTSSTITTTSRTTIDTTHLSYFIETFLYDTEKVDSDGTHPLKQYTKIHATKKSSREETETKEDTAQSLTESISVEHGKKYESDTKEKTYTRPRRVWLIVSSLILFVLFLLLKRCRKFW